MTGIPYAWWTEDDRHGVICPVCREFIAERGTKARNYAKHYASKHTQEESTR